MQSPAICVWKLATVRCSIRASSSCFGDLPSHDAPSLVITDEPTRAGRRLFAWHVSCNHSGATTRKAQYEPSSREVRGPLPNPNRLATLAKRSQVKLRG